MMEEGKCQIESTCAPSKNYECCCPMPEKLLALADEAWHDLLKEKIKDQISNSCGDNMDKLAKLVAETNKEKWAHTVKGKVKCSEYKDKLKDLFVEGSGA